jgi:hypothetical protein
MHASPSFLDFATGVFPRSWGAPKRVAEFCDELRINGVFSHSAGAGILEDSRGIPDVSGCVGRFSASKRSQRTDCDQVLAVILNPDRLVGLKADEAALRTLPTRK